MNYDMSTNTRGSRLYVMVGIPGTGKSTWARRNLPFAEYISRDEIRFSMLEQKDEYFANEKAVFATFVSAIVSAMSHDTDVVADATHINARSRAKLLNAIRAKFSEKFEVVFVLMDTCFAVAQLRNAKREGRARVPDGAMESMFNNFQAPTMDEDVYCSGVWTVREA